MNEAEFDKFADEYDAMHAAGLAVSGEGPEYFAEYKIKDIASKCAQFLALNPEKKILDFGAGIGGSVPFVHKHIPAADLTCIDISRRSLALAEKRFPSQAQYVHFDGQRIPFPSDHFDIAYAMCVFHHIPHEEHVALLRELRRVIRPGGGLFVFEHNPLNPLTVRVVNNCPFDENAKLIHSATMKNRLTAAGFSKINICYRIFFPHLFRALRPLEARLGWLPLGGQYYALSVK